MVLSLIFLKLASEKLGEVAADAFFKDQHPDVKADYIIANQLFNPTSRPLIHHALN